MSMLGRIVEGLGFVRASRYADAVDQRRKAESRSAKLSSELERGTGAAREWKARSEGLAQGLKQAQVELRRAQGELQRAQRDLVRDAEKLDHASKANERLRADLRSLKERLAAAERDLAVARENQMVLDVKLDILEGAARALDRRTRPAASE